MMQREREREIRVLENWRIIFLMQIFRELTSNANAFANNFAGCSFRGRRFSIRVATITRAETFPSKAERYCAENQEQFAIARGHVNII